MINEEEFKKLKSFPEEFTLLDYSRTFSNLEFEKLSNGLKSKSMDEKWNACMYNGALYMFRSWTGNCIYRIEFSSSLNSHSVMRTFANRNQDQYKEIDNKYDTLLLDFLISNLILGEQKPFPNKGNGNEPPGILQHSASGTAYSEIQYKPCRSSTCVSRTGHNLYLTFWVATLFSQKLKHKLCRLARRYLVKE